MKFNKYSAIYRNDTLIINDEYIIGNVKDLKEYFRYELANLCMSDMNYESLIFYGRIIIQLLEELETKSTDLRIKVYYNPMGALQYTTFIEEVINND